MSAYLAVRRTEPAIGRVERSAEIGHTRNFTSTTMCSTQDVSWMFMLEQFRAKAESVFGEFNRVNRFQLV